LFRPIGTPASQPAPVFGFGALGLEVGAVGFGLAGVVVAVVVVVDGAVVVGCVPGSEVELEGDEPASAELLGSAAGELLVGADVGVGAGVPVGEEVPTPAAACCAASVLPLLAPPEFDEHPVMPIATAPATAINAPPLPTPEVLMPLSTPGGWVSLLRRTAVAELLHNRSASAGADY
jgi:hypothetical protein